MLTAIAVDGLPRPPGMAGNGDPPSASMALVHGLAMLMLDEQVPHEEAMIDRVIGG